MIEIGTNEPRIHNPDDYPGFNNTEHAMFDKLLQLYPDLDEMMILSAWEAYRVDSGGVFILDQLCTRFLDKLAMPQPVDTDALGRAAVRGTWRLSGRIVSELEPEPEPEPESEPAAAVETRPPFGFISDYRGH